MYTVDLYLRVRLACHVDGLSQREAASRFGIARETVRSMCDGAGWHDERALTVPDNVTLALLPPYSPELNPVERVWLYLRERFLSLRVLDDTEAIIDACCQAWIDLIAEPDRMRTLCAYPWIMKVIS